MQLAPAKSSPFHVPGANFAVQLASVRVSLSPIGLGCMILSTPVWFLVPFSLALKEPCRLFSGRAWSGEVVLVPLS